MTHVSNFSSSTWILVVLTFVGIHLRLTQAQRLATPSHATIPSKIHRRVLELMQQQQQKQRHLHRRLQTVTTCDLFSNFMLFCEPCIDQRVTCSTDSDRGSLTYQFDPTGTDVVEVTFCQSNDPLVVGYSQSCVKYSQDPETQDLTTCDIIYDGSSCHSCRFCTQERDGIDFGANVDCTNLFPQSEPLVCGFFDPTGGGELLQFTLPEGITLPTVDASNPGPATTVATVTTTTLPDMGGSLEDSVTTTMSSDSPDLSFCAAFGQGLPGYNCTCNTATFTLECTLQDESTDGSISFELSFDSSFKNIVAGKFCSLGDDLGGDYTGACFGYSFKDDGNTPDTCNMSFLKANGAEDMCNRCEYCVSNEQIMGVDLDCRNAGGGSATCNGMGFSPFAPNANIFAALSQDTSRDSAMMSSGLWSVAVVAVLGWFVAFL